MLHAGVARTRISPPPGVELAGWGYYLHRIWQRVRDYTAVTALVMDDGKKAAVIIVVDLMYIDAAFTNSIRKQIEAATGIASQSILIACSHSHNTPTAAFNRGVGECNAEYVTWVEQQAAVAAIRAWKEREPARFAVGKAEVTGLTYNRTRPNGPVDSRLSVWRLDRLDGRPLAAVVSFQAHPTVMMALGATDLSRDAPGQITDILDAQLPGLTAMYLQGSCGDVNFETRYNYPALCREPGRIIAEKALEAFAAARPAHAATVASCSILVKLPTRRWTKEEIMRDRDEGLYRLKTGDTTGWHENIGRVMVNQPDRFPERYGGDVNLAVQAISRFAVEWTDNILKDIDRRPEYVETEVQAVRVGDAFLVANPSELFTTLALDLRRRWPHDDLMIAGYANDSIGYMPDAYDIERQTYAANQSPKFKGQFPFVAAAGEAMVKGMLEVLKGTVSEVRRL